VVRQRELTTDKPWVPILRRLTHRDVWGPGGIAPLEAFRRSGAGYVARCPHHRPDTHPSFAMREGRFDGYCFSCRYRVSWIDSVAQHLGVTDRRAAFWKAIEVLAARAGMPVPPRRLESNAPDAFETAARWLRARLLENTPVARRCRDYLVQRELIADVLELLPLGCLAPRFCLRCARPGASRAISQQRGSRTATWRAPRWFSSARTARGSRASRAACPITVKNGS
jgi:hypothetical protein